MKDERPSETAREATTGGPEGRAPERPASIGHYLAGQRRLRGISLDELSSTTRIPRRNIERLENGALDAAPDGFSRGFVRAIAEALGLDPDEAVMRLMAEPGGEDVEAVDLVARRRLVALVAFLALGVGLVGVVSWLLIGALLSRPEEAMPVLRYRSDAVRELAEKSDVPAPPAVPAEEP